MSHREFRAVCEAVAESHTELKNDLGGPEGTRLLDGELVSFLADDQLQVVVGCQLPFHHVDACKREGCSKVSADSALNSLTFGVCWGREGGGDKGA